MEIIIGKTAGFCYGVKRAIEGASSELKKSNNSIYCLGEIVHNKQVVNSLEEQGLIVIEDIMSAQGKTIIRAHGVEKNIYDTAKKRGIELKDYTCPNVLKIHEIADKYAKNEYFIFLCGSKNHPENIGTISYCGKNAYIIEKEEDILRALNILKQSSIKQLLLISQTTYSLEKFNIIEKTIRNKLPKDINLVVKNTICRATELRQRETKELAKKVDYMIIVVGANSSNTRKLYEIAKNKCNNCICVETSNQLNLKDIEKYDNVGIMAGASTPQKSIDEIVEKIKRKN